MVRSISNSFLQEFLTGSLSIMLNAVHNDTTLIMELRGKEVEIYYRGRQLVIIKEKSYNLVCNNSYWKDCEKYNKLKESPSIKTFVNNLALYKAPIDYYLATVKSFPEEQIKQQLVIENNILGKYAKKTGDYFILDTEYAFKDKDSEEGMDARFDAIALRWPSKTNARMKKKELGISFLELKYNDKAKTGSAGIKKHIEDYLAFIRKDEYCEMCKDMETLFVQKCKLGLIPAFKQSEKIKDISIDSSKNELVFVYANSDPDSTVDKTEWESIKGLNIAEDDLNKIFVGKASGFGYCLFRYENYGSPNQKDLYIKISDYYK